MYRYVSFILLSGCFVLSAPNLVHAKDKDLQKFRIAVGGYTLARNESSLSLTESNFGAGAAIDPETTLGINTEQTVFKLDGFFRFNRHHALTYSWYSISSDGNKTIEEQIDWVDENGDPITIPVGAQVDTVLDYDIFKVGYLWSFYSTDKVDLSAGVGLHTTRMKVGLQAETTSSGISAKDVALTVPLPVLSFGIIYRVTPKFNWYLKSEVFSLKYSDWDGNYVDNTLGMEFLVSKNVALGIGLGNNSLKISENNADYKFTFENRITGIDLYVATYF